MSVQRLIGFPVLLCVAAACATPATSSRTAIAPKQGPKVRIHATYDGGLTNRTVRASFKVDEKAYVMVGHLGGDGRITVLYPENAFESSLVKRDKTYQVRRFAAYYDGVPQLYSFISTAHRNPGARLDSYDGRGNGFVFIIASQYGLALDELAENGFWNEFLVEDYHSSYDPRLAIRDLARRLTLGRPYTIDYADSFGTTALTNYADTQWDCSVLSSGMYLGSAFFFSGLDPWVGGFGNMAWYLSRPSMFYTTGFTSFDRAGRCALGGRSYALDFSPPYFCARYTFDGAPLAPPTKPSEANPFQRRRAGLLNGNQGGPAVALSRPTFGGPRAGTSGTVGSSGPSKSSPGAREPGHSWSSPTGSRFTPPRTYDPPRAREPERFQPATHTISRPSPVTHESPRAATPTRAASSPPPKVEGGGGKPREP